MINAPQDDPKPDKPRDERREADARFAKAVAALAPLIALGMEPPKKEIASG